MNKGLLSITPGRVGFETREVETRGDISTTGVWRRVVVAARGVVGVRGGWASVRGFVRTGAL